MSLFDPAQNPTSIFADLQHLHALSLKGTVNVWVDSNVTSIAQGTAFGRAMEVSCGKSMMEEHPSSFGVGKAIGLYNRNITLVKFNFEDRSQCDSLPGALYQFLVSSSVKVSCLKYHL